MSSKRLIAGRGVGGTYTLSAHREAYPPSQNATGFNPWMNARWVPSIALAKEGRLRPSPSEVGYGRRRSEGSALRSMWRNAAAVRLLGLHADDFGGESETLRPGNRVSWAKNSKSTHTERGPTRVSTTPFHKRVGSRTGAVFRR